jgi:hypothetical protein
VGLPTAVSLEAARLSHLAQHRALVLAWLDANGETSKEKCRMTAPATWPTRKNEVASPHGDYAGEQGPAGQELPDHVPAHEVISEMADLLRDIRGSMMTDGCMLGAITIGFALEAGLSARGLRPGLAGVINLGLLGGIVFCWLVAVFLLARVSRPVLNTVSELRWVTGAPLDPRPGWVTLPPVGADPAEWTWNRAYLLVGAARLARERVQFADTWTYFTGGCFLAWTAIIILRW